MTRRRFPNPCIATGAAILLLLATLSITSCRGDGIVGFDGGDLGAPIEVWRGDRFKVTLQSVGPGEYLVPPEISGTAVQFLEVAAPKVVVPAGVTQPFVFRAANRGTATITFRHSEFNPTKQATVVVH